MKIEPIYASSEKRDDVYRLLNLVHSTPEYVLTVWTNGIVDVKAETRHGVHEYSMYAVEVENDDS